MPTAMVMATVTDLVATVTVMEDMDIVTGVKCKLIIRIIILIWKVRRQLPSKNFTFEV
jgi:hypothetical protein